MESKIHVKPNCKWKNVAFDSKSISNDGFTDLICFRELTDYNILSDSSPKVKEKLEKKRKKKNLLSKFQPIKEGSDKEKEKVIKKKRKNKDTRIKLHDNECDRSETLKRKQIDQGQSSKSKEIKKDKKKQRKRKLKDDSNNVPEKKKKHEKLSSEFRTPPENDIESIRNEMKAWDKLFVPEAVLKALYEKKFVHPTPIQALTLPSAIRDRMDIVGAAETGSGKTLAFGIPVLHNILQYKEEQVFHESSDLENIDDFKEEEEEEGNDNEDDSRVDSNEVEEEETGEDCEKDVIKEDEYDEGPEDEDDLVEEDENQQVGCVKVIDDADFSSLDLPSLETTPRNNKFPLALILQPTRELAIQVKNHLVAAAKYCDIRIAPVVGGMSIEKQKRILRKNPEILVATPGRLWELIEQEYEYLSNVKMVQNLVIDEADRMIEKGHFEELTKLLNYLNRKDNSVKRQIFVFSATLTMLHSGPQRQINKKFVLTEQKKLEMLMKKMKMKGKPKIVDITTKSGTVETLTEARINCTLEDKDVYLYYFLLQHPGRTLVFANSKDCIRRLISILTLLKTQPLPLHADMHQRQRLKNLDRFTGNPRGLLIASDVAARGLDIPDVQHVIHFQVPGTVENYVHRSGRTARAMKEGISVMLIAPDDMKNYRKIINNINKGEDLPLFPMDQQILPAIRKRVSLTKQIDTVSYRFQKRKRQNEWFEKAAKEMDMEFDENLLLNDLGDNSEQAQHKHYVKHLKAELDMLLRQSIVPKTFSGKYITRTGKLLVPEQPGTNKDAIAKVKSDKPIQDRLSKAIQKKNIKTAALKQAALKQKKMKKRKKNKKKS